MRTKGEYLDRSASTRAQGKQQLFGTEGGDSLTEVWKGMGKATMDGLFICMASYARGSALTTSTVITKEKQIDIRTFFLPPSLDNSIHPTIVTAMCVKVVVATVFGRITRERLPRTLIAPVAGILESAHATFGSKSPVRITVLASVWRHLLRTAPQTTKVHTLSSFLPHACSLPHSFTNRHSLSESRSILPTES